MYCEKKILIYGINQQAQQLYYYLSREGKEIEAFIVDKMYFKSPNLLKKPVKYFEDILHKYPPTNYAIILSFGYKNMVKDRQEKYNICRKMGYEILNFISKDAKVYSSQIGNGVIIYPNTVIEPFTEIGDGCFIEASCSIGHHSKIGKFNFFALGVTTGGGVVIGDNCFLGLSSTIASGKKIENRSLIGAGVCVTADVSEGTAMRHSEAIKLSKDSFCYL